LKAMILAGGLSTRLYPLTRRVPKPLVPIAGEPNSVHVVRYLRSFGIEDVAINVHYLADAVCAAMGNGSTYGVRLEYLHEPKLLGSAGAVKQMESFFDGTFVVVGCDDLTDLNIDTLLSFHREKKALATIGLASAEDVTQYGVVVLDESGRIIEFQEKPERGTEKSHLVNTGVYIFEPDIFGYMEKGVFTDFGQDVFAALQRENAAFYGLHVPGYWCDIGTPSEYRRATKDVLAGRVRLFGDTRVQGVPPDAKVGKQVRIEGDVRIGLRACIGDRVRIAGPSVIGDDVVIGEDAVLEGVIVWDRVRIGVRGYVKDSIVGAAYEVPADATIRDAVVADESPEEPIS
jgi:NDP-sugar pyrophosphorylase family protein